jgi:hypothetical protein
MRCKNGTRKNKKTGECEPSKIGKTSKTKRCPNGTQKNKNTKNCEPKKKIENFFPTLLKQTKMSNKVYIPNIYYGRDKYQFESKIVGIFKNKNDAIVQLIKELIKLDFIDFETYLNDIDSEEDIDEKEEKKNFTEMIINKVLLENIPLPDICKEYGDSYYKEGWKFKIEEFSFN